MSKDLNIYEHLRGRLIGNEFTPGQRLRSDQLKNDYGVAASTIRENLFRLSTVGLVNFQEQRGFRMPEISRALQHDLTQTRIILESEGASRSIRNGGVAWEARLNAAHHELKHIETRLRTATEEPELFSLWSAAELKFHRTLIEECRSDLIMEFHLSVFLRFRQQLITSDREFTFVPENVTQHQRILEAVLAHDEALVRQRIREHLARNLSELPVEENMVSLAG